MHRLNSAAFLASFACVTACSTPEETQDASETHAATETSVGSETSTAPESATGTEPTGETGEPSDRPPRLVMTSDWLAKRLSLLDYASVRAGESREQALWREVDLDGYEPGPLEAELSPDGSLALVAIAPGFFAGPAGSLAGAGPGQVPEGGGLLVVEIDTQTVLAELEPTHYPMGLVFNAEGSEAWTANYGGNGQSGTTLSRVDLDSLSIIEELELGPGPEQLALRGELALVNLAGEGSVRLFNTQDPAATLSAPGLVSNDPSWVLFVGPGDTRAVAINSLGPPGYSLLDISDPAAPVEIDEVEVVGIPYAAAPGAFPSEIVMSTIVGGEVHVSRYDTQTAELLDTLVIPAMGFPLGLVFEPEDEIALVPLPGANALAVVDFGLGAVEVIEWQAQAGPTYVALEAG